MEIVVDASPLIYLAKLDAFDAVANAGHTCVVPPSVYAEAARPELAFRHPEIAIIEGARRNGQLVEVQLGAGEAQLSIDLGERYGGLHAGELDVLAIGQTRGWRVCLHERQAARLAAALGVANIHIVEVLFAGTPDIELLERRIRQFARLTNMATNDLDALLELIRERL